MHHSFHLSELAVIYSPEFLDHDTGSFHPENAGRLTAVINALQATSWASQIDWCTPTSLAERDPLAWITQVHDPHYLEALQHLTNAGGGHIDGDTVVSPRSYAVARLAVNAWLDGVDYVLQTGHSAFVLARPPGHHAVRERGMGFCLLANAAIAAHYALQQPGIETVAILDWDVHHGNGTESLVETNPHIVYCSLHQLPGYPGTGRRQDRGRYQNVLNLPMAPGSSSADYRAEFEAEVMPFIKAARPDLLIVSAGYDATQADPLASICLQPSDFGDFTRYCLQVTDRILFGLEGGYDYDALGQSVVATLAARLNG